MPIERKLKIAVLLFVVFIAGIVFALPRLQFYQLMGRWFSVRIVDVLEAPQTVSGWSEDGLQLTDGRTIQLPGLQKLPTKSAALNEATKRGIEIASDGRVFGLVRVHHWCGNDPVREHISRVNIAELLKFLREGESSITLSKEAMKCVSTNPGGQFLSGHGWDIGEYGDFQSWTKLADATKIAAVNSEKRNP